MAGIGSRRQCDRLIAEGRVEVNGEISRLSGQRVDSSVDTVRVNGRVAVPATSRVTAVFHKPRGMLVTLRDQRGRPTVASVLEEISERVFPVGRLDGDSEGLLLLTNDGDLAYRVAHPKFGLPKTYHVTVFGSLAAEDVQTLREGVLLRDGRARPLEVRLLAGESQGSTVEIVLGEGRKREIRRMVARIGFEVDSLVRVGLGPLTLGGLRPGEWRLLNPAEARSLREAVGLETENGR